MNDISILPKWNAWIQIIIIIIIIMCCTCMYMYIYTNVCDCVCVCGCLDNKRSKLRREQQKQQHIKEILLVS